jgi:hypothetical protein
MCKKAEKNENPCEKYAICTHKVSEDIA